jgi:hypothetical protein
VLDQIEGYTPTTDAEAKKAKAFFDRATAVASTGNFDYAIELYVQGLEHDPENVAAHQALREISLRRKASGGKSLGMFGAVKLRGGKDDKQKMLNAEKLLAHDPGNTDHMQNLMLGARDAGFYETTMWIGPILQRANADLPKPDFNKFIALKDTYKFLKQWRLATDACQYALSIKPENMDLQAELKNLGAQQTMDAGGYGGGGGFASSMKDKDAQQRLLDADKGVLSEDLLARNIREAREQLERDPNEPGKIIRLAEAYIKTEDPENENLAIDLLEGAFQRTKQYRFKLQAGQIKIKQLSRMERSMRAEVARNPSDEGLKQAYLDFVREKNEEELKEFRGASEAYPSELSYKYQIATRLFELQRYDEAIPALQESRSDPKVRTDATITLGRAFLAAEYADEAVDTFRGVIEDYQLKGDAKSKEMYYWFGRALESKADVPTALKQYSQVAQWDFNYRDVQARIKALRTKPAAS